MANKKRNADWGHAAFNQKFNQTQLGFIERIADPAMPRCSQRPAAGLRSTGTGMQPVQAGVNTFCP